MRNPPPVAAKISDVTGTKSAPRNYLFKCSNLERGESMKDPVSIFGCWRGFQFPERLAALAHPSVCASSMIRKTHLRPFANARLTKAKSEITISEFFRARAGRSCDRDTRLLHRSHPQTDERPSTPPCLYRRRRVCTT